MYERWSPEPPTGDDPNGIVLSGEVHVRATVDLVRDHLFARSLFQADTLGFPLSPQGYDRVFVMGDRVTIEGRVRLDDRALLLSGTLLAEEPCRLLLSGVLHETGEDVEDPKHRYRRRFGRVRFEIRGRPDWNGTGVSFRFEVYPERRQSSAARRRLEEELRSRVERTTRRGLVELKGQLDRDLTAPDPKPWSTDRRTAHHVAAPRGSSAPAHSGSRGRPQTYSTTTRER